MSDSQSLPRSVGFDVDALAYGDKYKLVTGTVVPRPIALVTTLGPQGPNAAPFSFFNAVGADPPLLVFSAGVYDASEQRPDGTKDTIANLRAIPECVIHIVDFASREKMNVCAYPYPPGVSEIERAGFTTAPSVKVRPPRLVDCPAQLECRIDRIVEVGRDLHHVVFAEVVYMHYHEGIVDERHRVDPARLDAIARLGGNGAYIRGRDRFTMRLTEKP